jgi:hypothetical protein
MGQTEHRAYVKMKNAQEKAKRNPYFTDLKEKAKDAEIEWYKAKEKEAENEKLSKEIWGF